jgi:hypothetical protein
LNPTTGDTIFIYESATPYNGSLMSSVSFGRR